MPTAVLWFLSLALSLCAKNWRASGSTSVSLMMSSVANSVKKEDPGSGGAEIRGCARWGRLHTWRYAESVKSGFGGRGESSGPLTLLFVIKQVQ